MGLQKVEELEIKAETIKIEKGKVIAENLDFAPIMDALMQSQTADDLGKYIFNKLNDDTIGDFFEGMAEGYGNPRGLIDFIESIIC